MNQNWQTVHPIGVVVLCAACWVSKVQPSSLDSPWTASDDHGNEREVTNGNLSLKRRLQLCFPVLFIGGRLLTMTSIYCYVMYTNDQRNILMSYWLPPVWAFLLLGLSQVFIDLTDQALPRNRIELRAAWRGVQGQHLQWIESWADRRCS